MPTTMPAIKAKLGNTDYYILSMKAGELVSKATIPSKVPGWDDMLVEERYQREINASRVKNQIAPYFARNETRFCGSIILTALKFDTANCFEPLSGFKQMPNLYKAASESMGFLTFKGGELLVPLDGQHRLEAIRYAIAGKDNQGKDIPDIDPCTDLAEEDITIILIPFESKKARQIFTHVNRYAKPTTAGQNIVTDDDDFIAVLAREVANSIFHGRLVNYQSNTISNNASEFTTLANIYNCNEAIINNALPEGKFDKSQLPDSDTQKVCRNEVFTAWKKIVKSISPIADGIQNPEADGDENRKEIRKANLLGKPIPQEALVQAYLRLTNATTNMSGEQACARLNSLPWGITADNIAKYWGGVLWIGGVEKGKIVYRNRALAARFIAYLAGEKLTPEGISSLEDSYLHLFSDEDRVGKKLPEPIKAA